MWNVDKTIEQTGPGTLAWTALTTGGFGGFDAVLADPGKGRLKIDTALVKCDIAVADIGRDDTVFEAGGIGRRLRIFRLPDENSHRTAKLSRRIALKGTGDSALCQVSPRGTYLVWSARFTSFVERRQRLPPVRSRPQELGHADHRHHAERAAGTIATTCELQSAQAQ